MPEANQSLQVQLPHPKPKRMWGARRKKGDQTNERKIPRGEMCYESKINKRNPKREAQDAASDKMP